MSTPTTTSKTKNSRSLNQIKTYPTNIREIHRPDGTIVKEYVFENPRLTRNSQGALDFTSSGTTSDDDQPSSREKFAKIKAKFERGSSTNQTSSPTSSSSSSSIKLTTTNRRSSKSTVEFGSHPLDRHSTQTKTSFEPASPLTSHRTRSLSNSQPLNSLIGQNLSNVSSNFTPSIKQNSEQVFSQSTAFAQFQNPSQKQQPKHIDTSQIQYEVTDEYGNVISVQGIEEILKMSGIESRDVPQSDGTVLKEYLVDDPKILSKVHAERLTSTFQPTFNKEHGPPPPPRVVRQAITSASHLPLNIENVDHLLPEQHYEYRTKSGRHIQFFINDVDSSKCESTFAQINALNNAVHNNLSLSSSKMNLPIPSSTTWNSLQDQISNRQVTPNNGFSLNETNKLDEQIIDPSNENKSNQFGPIVTEPIIDWSILRQQDPEGQVDPEMIRQFIQQRFQQDTAQLTSQIQSQQEINGIQEIPIRHESLSQYGFIPQNRSDSRQFQYDQQQFNAMSINATGRF